MPADEFQVIVETAGKARRRVRYLHAAEAEAYCTHFNLTNEGLHHAKLIQPSRLAMRAARSRSR